LGGFHFERLICLDNSEMMLAVMMYG
jgi:hypothetical protein